jgi:hypothetical protein
VRSGLVRFCEKMSSSNMAKYNMACYVPTLDTQAVRRGAPTLADDAIATFNTECTPRRMGLVILDAKLLQLCTLNLSSVLHSDVVVDRTEADWYKTIFCDPRTRTLLAAEMHACAHDVVGADAMHGGGGGGGGPVDACIVALQLAAKEREAAFQREREAAAAAAAAAATREREAAAAAAAAAAATREREAAAAATREREAAAASAAAAVEREALQRRIAEMEDLLRAARLSNGAK